MQTIESPFSAIPGAEYIAPGRAQILYGKDTSRTAIRIAGALQVFEPSALPEILRIANEHRSSLWPVSQGRNFGYGSSVPSVSGCIVVDLSELREISWNGRARVVTVEPGVSLDDLYKFLAAHKLDYLVPVTGAGGQGSVIGNALDGGIGLTPYGDHFEAMTHAEGFWGSGDPFEALFDRLGCGAFARGWKQSLGPSTLGLLRQGRYGLVTKASFRLRSRPEASALLELRWPTAAAFFESQAELSRILDDAPVIAAFTAIQPGREHIGQGHLPSGETPWTCVAPIFGSKESVEAASRTAARRLKGVDVSLHSASSLKRMSTWRETAPSFLGFLAAMPGTGVSKNSGALGGFAKLLAGEPHFDAFLQAILPADTFRALTGPDLPGDSGIGLLWYSALLNPTEAVARKFSDMARRVLARNGISAPLILSMVDSRTVVARIPLIFEKSDTLNAKACIKDLIDSGLKMEIPPQRLSATGWNTVAGAKPDAQWASLQKALDPHEVLWPHRGAT